MTFKFKRTENHNFYNYNQYEPACGMLSLLNILELFIFSNLYTKVQFKGSALPVADPGFPRGGVLALRCGGVNTQFAKFSQKLHEI